MSNLSLSSIGFKINSPEDLKNRVPAAFATEPHPDRTARYNFVLTEEMLQIFDKSGWEPFSAKQHGSNQYGRHIIRLANKGMGSLALQKDKVLPQILLDNSHDGFTSASIHLGLFRLVCSNGLVVAQPGLSTSIKFRHIGVDTKELLNIIAESSEQYSKIGQHITEMQTRTMSKEEQTEFAIRALALREPLRFMNEDKTPNLGLIMGSTDPNSLIVPMRSEDKNPDLWSTFNLVQERMVKGLYERKSANGKKGSPREITNAARNLAYNKDIWQLAESFM